MRVFVGLIILGIAGCAAPAKTVCPPVPKCPPTFAEQYREAENTADRLEDALREANKRTRIAEDGSQACVREFEDIMRKDL